MWRRASIDTAYGDEKDVRGRLEEVLPELKRFGSATVRRMVIDRELDAVQALGRAVALAEKLSALLARGGSVSR